MNSEAHLHDLLAAAAARRPAHPAAEEAGGATIAYAELDRLSDRLRDRLQALGVVAGDRVGIWVHKSIDSLAAIFGILKTGAAYVPVDPGAPASRNAYIFANCGVRAAIVEAAFEADLRRAWDTAAPVPAFVVQPEAGGGSGLSTALDALDAASPAATGRTLRPGVDALAYILYTSGSTGRPKGVMLSHRNAASFVDWCCDTFDLQPSDRFSAHAPFHFDLSIFDIFVSAAQAATLVLIGEEQGKEPVGLAALIARTRISVWYSAPSILSLLAQRGRLETHDASTLRLVLFAGEVFPIVHLRSLTQLWPWPAYYNLYGPTETNVCTYFRLPDVVDPERTNPFPIGAVCNHLQGIVVDDDGRPVDDGTEGELCIAGPGVMQGYWGDPELTLSRCLERDGVRWYRTGDVVVRESSGDYRYMGRRDRMVKKRGYRIELGEIEACLSRHPEVREVAVVALPHTDQGLVVKAHVATDGGKRLSLLRLKEFTSRHVPVYMVPDEFVFHAALPKTSTDKTDYRRLAELG